MDESTRTAWSTPELVVLVRGTPEEAVLDACKDAYQIQTSPTPTHFKCTSEECTVCGLITAS